MGVFVGDENDNFLKGGSGIDTLFGKGGDDTLKGGGGHDTLIGGTGYDTMLGGTGNDLYVVDEWSKIESLPRDKVVEYEDQGIDKVESYAPEYTLPDHVEHLTLLGSALRGRGNDLNNKIIGNAKNNYIIGGGGPDYMVGGDGDDAYQVDSSADIIIEDDDAAGGLDTVFSSVSFGLSASLEDLTLTGTTNINGYGNSKKNVLWGNASVNYLFGFGENDVLDGQLGADWLYGGTGDDDYHVYGGDETIVEIIDEGMDEVTSGALSYTLSDHVEVLYLNYTSSAVSGTGNDQKNWIYGNQNNNVIDGKGDDDLLDGGTGNDSLIGGLGNDTYILDSASDTITEVAGQGADTLKSSTTYTLAAGVEVEVMMTTNANATTAIDFAGNEFGQTMNGNNGNNVLNGVGGSDTINGFDGNDQLWGGAGIDTLAGGVGDDIFVFLAGEANGDIIVDYTGSGDAPGDAIQLVGYGPGATFTQVDATHWQVTYNGGASFEVITFLNGGAGAVHPSDIIFG